MGEAIVRWYLVSPSGDIIRTNVAENIAEARFRLAPIPPGCFVASTLDFLNGYHKAIEPPARKGRGGWYANAKTPQEQRAIQQRLSDSALLGLRKMREETPNREAARRQKIAAYQTQLRKRQRQARAEAMRQANIMRWIEWRKVKRQQQEK